MDCSRGREKYRVVRFGKGLSIAELTSLKYILALCDMCGSWSQATGDSNGIWDTTIAKLCDMIQVLVTYQVPYKPTPVKIG